MCNGTGKGCGVGGKGGTLVEGLGRPKSCWFIWQSSLHISYRGARDGVGLAGYQKPKHSLCVRAHGGVGMDGWDGWDGRVGG